MENNYEERVRQLGGRTLTPKEAKELTQKVQRKLRPIFIEREKELQNIPPSNFRF